MTSNTQQSSSLLRSVLKTTWHHCISHSSLLCGDSSSTRLLILYSGKIWLILLRHCESVSTCLKSAEDLIVGEVLNRGRFDQAVEKFNRARRGGGGR